MANYIVQEIQTNGGATALVTPYVYPTREAAESAFYTICGSAVISAVEKHTVTVYTEEGFQIAELTKCFKHTAQATQATLETPATPEPQETEETEETPEE